MKITDVKIQLTDKADSRMKGKVSVTLDECFVIHGIRIIEGDKGLFVAMPSRETATGEYRDIVHPISKECREMFETTILDAYKAEIK